MVIYYITTKCRKRDMKIVCFKGSMIPTPSAHTHLFNIALDPLRLYGHLDTRSDPKWAW